MKPIRKTSRVALAVGCVLASVPVLGISSPGAASPPEDGPIDGGIHLPPELELDGTMYDPKPGNGYNPFSSVPSSNLPWEIKLTPEAEKAGLRSAANATASDFTKATGVKMTVAAGTVSSTYSPSGEEVLIHSSSTVDGSATCSGTSNWIGCGGPTSTAQNDVGVWWLDGGEVTIHPKINGRGLSYLTQVIQHEVGHVFGLHHYDAIFEGQYQVMRSYAGVPPGYKSGDKNGLRNAVDLSKNAALDSAIPGLVVAAGESLDFDGDGKSDVFHRSGDGTWQYSSGGVKSWGTLSTSVAQYQDMRFGDFDGDGKTDVFTSVQADGTYQWKYRPAGVGTQWTNLATSTTPMDKLRFGDFDGDGKTDVFGIQKEGSTYRWRYSSGGVTSWKNLATAGNPIEQLRFGDFDGDAKTDVFIAQKEGRGYRWKYSSGGATSWKDLAFAGNPIGQLRFGDFDGDGKTDVFVAQKEGRGYRWKYSSGGTKSWKNLATAGNPIGQLRFGDFNGDDKTDVFSRTKYNNRWYWQYSSAGATSWKRMATSGAALASLRVS